MPFLTSRRRQSVVAGAVLLIAISLGFLFWRALRDGGGAEEYPLSWFVIVAAVLGSLVNQPSRDAELQRASLGWILGYLLWKSTVSIVFAFALYMMFIGGLIGGDMFPRFVATEGEYRSMIEFATKIDPQSYKDVAKMLVWSFIAGYSERFVPNLISQILKASQERHDS